MRWCVKALRSTSHTANLATNKQIREEARNVFFGEKKLGIGSSWRPEYNTNVPFMRKLGIQVSHISWFTRERVIHLDHPRAATSARIRPPLQLGCSMHCPSCLTYDPPSCGPRELNVVQCFGTMPKKAATVRISLRRLEFNSSFLMYSKMDHLTNTI